MPADDSLDQSPFSLPALLAARYPQWTIWYGQTTRRWWALPPAGRGADRFVEAHSVKELVESIEAMQSHPLLSPLPPQPNGILFGEAEALQAGRVPATAWPGRDRR
jgi:hypothetical protein